MCLKIRCDGESEKFCKTFWEVNKAKTLESIRSNQGNKYSHPSYCHWEMETLGHRCQRRAYTREYMPLTKVERVSPEKAPAHSLARAPIFPTTSCGIPFPFSVKRARGLRVRAVSPGVADTRDVSTSRSRSRSSSRAETAQQEEASPRPRARRGARGRCVCPRCRCAPMVRVRVRPRHAPSPTT